MEFRHRDFTSEPLADLGIRQDVHGFNLETLRVKPSRKLVRTVPTAEYTTPRNRITAPSNGVLMSRPQETLRAWALRSASISDLIAPEYRLLSRRRRVTSRPEIVSVPQIEPAARRSRRSRSHQPLVRRRTRDRFPTSRRSTQRRRSRRRCRETRNAHRGRRLECESRFRRVSRLATRTRSTRTVRMSPLQVRRRTEPAAASKTAVSPQRLTSSS